MPFHGRLQRWAIAPDEQGGLRADGGPNPSLHIGALLGAELN